MKSCGPGSSFARQAALGYFAKYPWQNKRDGCFSRQTSDVKRQTKKIAVPFLGEHM
jgi:hypothetical protein